MKSYWEGLWCQSQDWRCEKKFPMLAPDNRPSKTYRNLDSIKDRHKVSQEMDFEKWHDGWLSRNPENEGTCQPSIGKGIETWEMKTKPLLRRRAVSPNVSKDPSAVNGMKIIAWKDSCQKTREFLRHVWTVNQNWLLLDFSLCLSFSWWTSFWTGERISRFYYSCSFTSWACLFLFQKDFLTIIGHLQLYFYQQLIFRF